MHISLGSAFCLEGDTLGGRLEGIDFVLRLLSRGGGAIANFEDIEESSQEKAGRNQTQTHMDCVVATTTVPPCQFSYSPIISERPYQTRPAITSKLLLLLVF